MFGVIFVLGAVVAIIKADPANEGSKKTWKPKKKNFFVRLGETGDPVHFPK